MKLSDFPMTVGKLRRKKAEKEGHEVTGIVYALNQKIPSAGKYSPIRHIPFRVTQQGAIFMVHINDRPFRQAHSVEDVAINLVGAFDQECIRAGIQAASPRLQAPPDLAAFQKPRG